MPKGIPKSGINKGWFKIGFKHTEENKKKISENSAKVWLGKKFNDEHIENLRKAHKGKVAWNKGIKRWWKSSGGFTSDRVRGDKNNRWKGGITPLNHKIRTSAEYLNILKSTKERDDYRCFWCGVRGIKLNSDHILRFADCPRLRLEPNNIQTLCVNCHGIKTKGDRTGKYILC